MDGQSTAKRVLGTGRVPHAGLDHEQLAAQYGWVHAVARNLVRDPWGADDVTQETLLAALASPPPDVPDDQRLRAWLGRVAFNLSRLGVRQGARRRAREVHVARAEATPSVSDELESASTVNELSRAIAELSEPDRRVVLLRYFDGLSTAAIAAQTGVSELAVRKRLWRARNKLRVALEPERRSGQFMALLLHGGWKSFARLVPLGGREGGNGGLAGLAAGLALCAGATWWWGRSVRNDEPRAPSVAEGPQSARSEIDGHAADADASLAGPRAPHFETPARRSWVPPTPKAPLLESSPEEARSAFAQGLALDLEGGVRAGLALFEAGAPGDGAHADVSAADAQPGLLATTDALGGFRLPVRAAPFSVEARGQGLATVLRARFEPGERDPQLLLVAPARDLSGRVIDADGVALADVRCALFCDETAFARVERPVRLDSAVLCTFASDALGRIECSALPRAAGLHLRLECAGFETLERPTLALASEELFVLRATPALAELSGSVRRQDGRPAVGASVRLARASTRTDEQGRFRLPLRDVRSDSPLEASDKNAAPTRVPRFGSRLLEGHNLDVELVLGDEHDSVNGKLLGPSAAGWLVAAYPEQGAKLDDKGREIATVQSHSDATGAFEFALPRGTYTLFALAPDAVQVARRTGLDSRSGSWELALPRPTPCAALQGTVQNSDGALLARAEVGVSVLLDGVDGRRALPWQRFASGPHGEFGFPCDPTLAVELDVVYADSSGTDTLRTSFACANARGSFALVVPRAAWLQVAPGAVDAAACSLLDADGAVLAARGPLQRGEHFALREGRSPVLEVPSSARWLALERPGFETLRVPIEPQPGRLLKISP